MAADLPVSGYPVVDPEAWVDEHGDYLFRYALRRVLKRDLAEDLVQDTFSAALGARERYEGRASERTWLLSILKHKIIDYIRKESREGTAINGNPNDQQSDDFFDERGRWAVKPSRWENDPRKVAENKEFLKVFTDCLAELPRKVAHAFVLREIEEHNGEEASEILKTSVNHVGVLLYRARLQLRRCLELNWFTQ